MDNKLTLEICFKYPSAKIKRYYEEGLAVSSSYKNIQDLMLSHTNYHDIPELLGYDSLLAFCKLQLRKLESLTDEEKKAIEYKFLEVSYNYVSTHKDGIINFQNLLWYCREINKKDFIDWCRKNRFDIDNLIESGIAEEMR